MGNYGAWEKARQALSEETNNPQNHTWIGSRWYKYGADRPHQGTSDNVWRYSDHLDGDGGGVSRGEEVRGAAKYPTVQRKGPDNKKEINQISSAGLDTLGSNKKVTDMEDQIGNFTREI